MHRPMCLGVDVGGTFTDFYLIRADGSVSTYKRSSTPNDPSRAILEGLREMDTSPPEIVHGSTVATNAIIERKGAKTALITTAGFRDVLAIGRQTRPRLYDLSPRREPPLVPDDLRLEVSERIDHQGNVLFPLNPTEVERLLDSLQAEGVESLAICLLFSFLDPNHERIVADAARRRNFPVSASHEVLPEHREYERTSTTVANAYVSPIMTTYLGSLDRLLRDSGVQRLRIMSSSGGSISPGDAGRLAIRTAVSGPAGGVAGAFAISSAGGFDRIITLDMGGTSTDVSLCPGAVLRRDETTVGAFPVRGPTVDVLSVGAGGGSIARLDAGEALRVGPESAGADPGPACYGVGMDPTVTDAHVVLGRIVGDHFLGGRMEISAEAALEAALRVSGPYGGDPGRTAAAVLRVANANMERALRVVSVERGHDPRDFTLVPFGGAGGLHACDIAESLRIGRILVPRHPGVLSALGMATAPIINEQAAAVLQTVSPGDADITTMLDRLFQGLESRARSALEEGGFSPGAASSLRSLDLRYLGQSYELPVDIQSTDPNHFLPLFHAAHEERYGHSHPGRTVEIVTGRVRVSLPPPTTPSGPASVRSNRRFTPGPVDTRTVGFPGRRGVRKLKTAFYQRESLTPGASFDGPAVIVQMDSTTVVAPGWHARADPFENMLLSRRS